MLCSFYIAGRPALFLREKNSSDLGKWYVGWELEKNWCGKWRGSDEGENMVGVYGMK